MIDAHQNVVARYAYEPFRRVFSMSGPPRRWSGSFRVATAGLVVIFLIIGGAYFWLLHPWIAPKTAIFCDRWSMSGNNFEVWQIKNVEVLEPFATGLFIRCATDQWLVVCLDHQDYYKPEIELREEGTLVHVTHRGNHIGALETKTQTFRRTKGGQIVTMVPIRGAPPGNWWITP